MATPRPPRARKSGQAAARKPKPATARKSKPATARKPKPTATRKPKPAASRKSASATTRKSKPATPHKSTPAKSRKPKKRIADKSRTGRSKASRQAALAAYVGVRLSKVLAQSGLGSRHEVDQWISAGRVKVNGAVAKPGQRYELGARLQKDGAPLRLKAPAGATHPRVLLYHKPEGTVCTRSDSKGRPTIFDTLPRLSPGRWIQVGRLDINSSGLMLFSNDGDLAHHLMHPSSNIDREYLVRVFGEVDEAVIARLKRGVVMDGEKLRFTDVQRGQDAGGRNQWFSVALMQGRNREVRKLWESQGVQVSRLKRVRFGPAYLTSTLRRGHWRELNAKEVGVLCEDVGYSPQNTR